MLRATEMAKTTSDAIRDYKRGTNFGSVGLELVICLAVGYFGGRYLDQQLDTAPWLSVVGFVFGVGAGIKSLHRAYVQMQTIARLEEREHGNPKPSYEDDPPSKGSESHRD